MAFMQVARADWVYNKMALLQASTTRLSWTATSRKGPPGMRAPPGTAGSNSDQMSVFATAGALPKIPVADPVGMVSDHVPVDGVKTSTWMCVPSL
jgi:hypothetical protein